MLDEVYGGQAGKEVLGGLAFRIGTPLLYQRFAAGRRMKWLRPTDARKT